MCHLLVRDDLGKTKIGDLDVALGVEKKILWLQIAVDDVEVVHVFKC